MTAARRRPTMRGDGAPRASKPLLSRSRDPRVARCRPKGTGDDGDRERPRAHAEQVPEASLIFRVIKIMSTTVGENGAGYLAVHSCLETAMTDGIMVALLATALAFQFRALWYVPWVY